MNFHREIFSSYLTIKHSGLINLTLNPMGEVNSLIDKNKRNDELEKLLFTKMQKNIANNLVK